MDLANLIPAAAHPRDDWKAITVFLYDLGPPAHMVRFGVVRTSAYEYAKRTHIVVVGVRCVCVVWCR